MGDVAFVVVTGFRLCGAADQYEKENQKQLHRCRKSQLSRFHYPQKARTEAEPGLLLTPHGKWIQIPYSDVMPGFGLNASGSRPLADYFDQASWSTGLWPSARGARIRYPVARPLSADPLLHQSRKGHGCEVSLRV